MSKMGKHFSPEFKTQLVLQLLREENTVNELATKHQISPVVIGRWKKVLPTPTGIAGALWIMNCRAHWKRGL